MNKLTQLVEGCTFRGRALSPRQRWLFALFFHAPELHVRVAAADELLRDVNRGDLDVSVRDLIAESAPSRDIVKKCLGHPGMPGDTGPEVERVFETMTSEYFDGISDHDAPHRAPGRRLSARARAPRRARRSTRTRTASAGADPPPGEPPASDGLLDRGLS